MDTEKLAKNLETNVYHLTSETEVPLHQHDNKDEIFYCLQGKGTGILAGKKQKLTTNDTFVVPAGKQHTIKTQNELYVVSVLVSSVQ